MLKGKMIKLEAKSKKLKLRLTIDGDGITKEILLNPGNALRKRLEAVAVGLRSELTMFLLEIERDIDFRE